jgi:uncharacterized membrane protein YphA (DoxX/SURF4 family)
MTTKPSIALNSNSIEARLAALARPVFGAAWMRFVAHLGLCAAYLQGGLNKLTDFNGAITEMNHFGVAPAAPFAVVVIVLELVASVMILTGFFRWLGALGLGGFTLLATFLALRFWELPPGMERFMAANSFFEHLGLVGGFLLTAWLDLNRDTAKTKEV